MVSSDRISNLDNESKKYERETQRVRERKRGGERDGA